MRTLNIINIVNSISSKNTGLSYAVRNLYDSFSIDTKINFEIVTTENDGSIFSRNDSKIHSFEGAGPWWYSKKYSDYLKSRKYLPDTLMHIHGVWLYPHYVAAKIAVKKKVPYIITTHGMMSEWHMNRKYWKLMTYLKLIEQHNLAKAECVHVLTEHEKEHLKRLIPDLRNIEVIPNGINTENLLGEPDLAGLLDKFPQIKNRKVILYMGRITPAKSIQELIEAWLITAKTESKHILMVCGSDFEGLQENLEKMINKQGLDDRVIFTGFLTGKLKLAAYNIARIFVSPSQSEAIGLVNLEAMWLKLPILTSRQTGILDVEKYGAGKYTLPSVVAIAENLKKMIDTPDNELKQMGEQGRKLVEDKYTIEKVNSQMKELYKSIF